MLEITATDSGWESSVGCVRAQRVALHLGGAASPMEREEVTRPPTAQGLQRHPGKESRKTSKKQLENGTWTQGGQGAKRERPWRGGAQGTGDSDEEDSGTLRTEGHRKAMVKRGCLCKMARRGTAKAPAGLALRESLMLKASPWPGLLWLLHL